MKFRFSPLCVVVLLLLSGCAGSPSPDAKTTTTPLTDTTANPLSETTTSASTPTTTTILQAMILDYHDLEEPTQQTLQEVIENGSMTITRANLTGELSTDKDGWYVRHRGKLYKISLKYRGFRGEYNLENATKINSSTIEDSTAVIEYRNLSEHAQQLFDVARTDGETRTYGAKAFPDQLQTNRYMKYQGEYYELRIVVGDYTTYRLSLKRV